MAEFGWIGKGSTRGPSLRGRVMLDLYRGSPRARKWPRGRKYRLKAKTKEQNDWFFQAQYATKYWDPWLFQTYAAAVKKTLLLPRDIMTMQMAGRLAYITRADGSPIWSKQMRQDMSYSLDVITHTPGTMLYRGADDWIAIPPGTVDQVLTYQSAATPPAWTDAGGRGGGAMVKLDEIEITAPQLTIDFSGISDAYSDLILQLSSRTSAAVTSSATRMKINNDNSALYDGQWGQITNATTATFQSSAANNAFIGDTSGASINSGWFSDIEITIAKYSRNDRFKIGQIRASREDGTPTGNKISTYAHSFFYRNTAKINQITLFLDSARSFDVGTIATLYGRQ